jgi:hypothetical protein
MTISGWPRRDQRRCDDSTIAMAASRPSVTPRNPVVPGEGRAFGAGLALIGTGFFCTCSALALHLP